MSLENVSIEDCINMYEKKRMSTVIAAGQVVGFIPREE